MRVRTFLTLVLMLGLAATVVFLLLPNRETLEQPIVLGSRSLPVWGAILAAFTLGALFGLIFEVMGAGRGAVTRVRGLLGSRRSQSAERALERGRQAVREARLEEAIGHFREACERAPSDRRGPMALGDALRHAGRPQEAAAAHEQARALAADGDDEATHALALDHLDAGRLDDARRELTALVRRSPRSAVGPLRQLRDLEVRAGDWEAAERAQRRLESLGHAGAPADRAAGLGIRTELARSRARAGQTRAAIQQLRRVLKEDPDFLPAILLLAELQQQAGDAAAARSGLLSAFERTGEPVLLDALAGIDLARERPQEAIATLRGLVAGRHYPAAARLALGRLYLRLEMLEEAARQLTPLHDELPGAAIVAALLARAEERRGRLARAAALYREALDALPVPAALCRACGAGAERWEPRCPACGAFGALSSSAPLEPRRETGASGAPGPVYELAGGE